jgi:hypothetical protein
MTKEAISVTLDADNITWLKARTTAGGARSVSELIDQIVSAARTARTPIAATSVVGTVEIDAHDPKLESADGVIRALFDASLGRPLVARETRGSYRAARGKRGRSG